MTSQFLIGKVELLNNALLLLRKIEVNVSIPYR